MTKRRRGFAVMDPARQREIASKGGRAAHEKGTAHRWSEQEAKEAGRKGGAASHRNGHRTATRAHAVNDTAASGAGEQINQADQTDAVDQADQNVSDDFTTDDRIAEQSKLNDSDGDHSRS